MPDVKSARIGDILVGYRFQLDRESFKLALRGGTGATAVIDQPAISGPILLGARSRESDRWEPNFFFAICAGCNDRSRDYKNRSRYLQNWALAHRCQKRIEHRAATKV